MNPSCPINEHLCRRAFMKSTLAGAGGVLINWGSLFGSQTIADQTSRSPKRCILLWMNGGASQLDTFDMKPGRPTAGPFRPISTNVTGVQICEYLPLIAQQVNKLAIIRSMRTQTPDHPGGIYHMHTCYRRTENIPHPEIGAMVARYLGNPDADLPSFVRMGPTGNAGAGFLGPNYEPFSMSRDGRLPTFARGGVNQDIEERRAELLRFVEQGFAETHQAEPFAAHQTARERTWRLMRARAAFDIEQEWPRYRDLYGDGEFGRRCLLARKLIENGVPFVEVGQDNYDSHADNFVVHKGNLRVLDKAWSGLLQDLQQRGLLEDTLVVWMGEIGRTPRINNRAGRDHYVRAWTIVLAGGGTRGGIVYGETDTDGRDVRNNPVSEGDLFATIYTLLGIDPRVRHFVGTRPIWATPEGSGPIRDIMA